MTKEEAIRAKLDGKTVQKERIRGHWHDVTLWMDFDVPGNFRLKPEPMTFDLGPDDVDLHKAVFGYGDDDDSSFIATYCEKAGLRLGSAGSPCTWENLRRQYRWKPNGTGPWLPCQKEVKS